MVLQHTLDAIFLIVQLRNLLVNISLWPKSRQQHQHMAKPELEFDLGMNPESTLLTALVLCHPEVIITNVYYF